MAPISSAPSVTSPAGQTAAGPLSERATAVRNALIGRVDAIDLVRGLVMVIMLLDHTRDFTHMSGFLMDPLDNARTTPALYATRWITHLCATTFVLLAGTSSGIQRIRGTSPNDLAWFLFSRGLWLVVMELTIVRVVTWWNIMPNMLALLQVIWAIGVSMMVLAFLVKLPMRVVGLIGLAIVVGHNALDVIQVPGFQGPNTPVPTAGAKLWMVLHQGGIFPIAGAGSPIVLAMYPLIPWLGLLLAGYGLAELYAFDATRRRTWLFGIAVAMLVTFIALRTGNVYGDPLRWSPQPTTARTIMSYMNVQKYGPSLLFTCATLFVPMLLLALNDRRPLQGTIARALVTYGRVPMFFYILQWMWAKIAGFGVALAYGRDTALLTMNVVDTFTALPTAWGGPLWLTYLCWALGAILLYFPCRWYADLKARRKDLTLLRYL
ncbi:MAG TPA: heparan-alpha-glucosaminide N-acetyltransferase domain-containing protein [Gemmatimonas sp.]|nr:heparan-alpha-glucosaminide N-acetyltransferase domain-containing protein [Gemmatimonas sp.]